jgi:hypothetical protein
MYTAYDLSNFVITVRALVVVVVIISLSFFVIICGL